MNEGITAEEACQTRALTPEDFARMCTEDGSLKTQQTDPASPEPRIQSQPQPLSTPAQPGISTLQTGLIGVVLVVVVLAAVFIKRHNRRP